MSNKSKFVQAMISDFMESYGLDESGKLTVVNESVAKKTDALLSKLVLEKSVSMFDKLEESSTEHLQGLADEISFQELNGDGSSLTGTRASAMSGDKPAAQDQGDQGGFDFELPESVEEFDLNSLFEMEDEEEEKEEEEEGELKEFAGHDMDPDLEQDPSDDDGSFQDLDIDYDNEGGDLDDASMGGDEGGLDDAGLDAGDDAGLGGDADEVNLDDNSDPFDFDFDLPGEELPGAEHGDDEDDLKLDDEDDLSESKKKGKGTTKKMGIVPNDRKSSKASLA